MRTPAKATNAVVDIHEIQARLAIISSEIRFLQGANVIIEAETAEIVHHLEHIAQALEQLEPPREPQRKAA